jgi:hypothetical protein
MVGFVEGLERSQTSLFPASLEDYVTEDNPVRAIDAFVDGIDLRKLGFTSMPLRRQTAEHPFGTIKGWMGWTHFLTMTLPKVATEMALNVLAYSMKRVMAIVGVRALVKVVRA